MAQLKQRLQAEQAKQGELAGGECCMLGMLELWCIHRYLSAIHCTLCMLLCPLPSLLYYMQCIAINLMCNSYKLGCARTRGALVLRRIRKASDLGDDTIQDKIHLCILSQKSYACTCSLICHLNASKNYFARMLQANWRLPARLLRSCSSSCSRLSSRTRLWPGSWLRGVSRLPAMWSSSSSCKTCGSSWSACMLSLQEPLCRSGSHSPTCK